MLLLLGLELLIFASQVCDTDHLCSASQCGSFCFKNGHSCRAEKHHQMQASLSAWLLFQILAQYSTTALQVLCALNWCNVFYSFLAFSEGWLLQNNSDSQCQIILFHSLTFPLLKSICRILEWFRIEYAPILFFFFSLLYSSLLCDQF